MTSVKDDGANTTKITTRTGWLFFVIATAGYTADNHVRVRISSTTIVDAIGAACDALVTRMKWSQHESWGNQ